MWVLYNAWRKDKALVDEAAVEDEKNYVIRTLNDMGYESQVYALESVAGLTAEINSKGKPRLILNLAEAYCGDAGKEAHVAALLELLDLPYTGNSSKTLTLAQDKILTKRLLSQAGIPTPPWTVFDGDSFPQTEGLAYPLIAKPSREDASLGISSKNVCSRPQELKAIAEKLFTTFRQPILIEKYIEGRELNASILQKGSSPTVLPLSEILFDSLPKDQARLVGYDAKWNQSSIEYRGTPAECPAQVEPTLQARIIEISRGVFTLLEGKDYGRVDFRIDRSGNPWVLEYNPNPDISPGAGFVLALNAGQIGFPGFLKILLENNGYV